MITLAIIKLYFFFAAAGNCDLPKTGAFNFLHIPHWWEYLGKGQLDGLGNCTPQLATSAAGSIHGILAIGLAIIDILLHVAGLIVVAYVIIAGIQYILSTGNAEKTQDALRRIINASIGLAIVLTATATVTFLGNSFK